MLANHDQNKSLSCFRLVQSVCIDVMLESSAVKAMVTFGLARSIEFRAECYILQISNLALAHLKRLGFYIFIPGI